LHISTHTPPTTARAAPPASRTQGYISIYGMVEVCGKNWEIIIAVITGEPGFFIFYFKNNNRRGENGARAAFSYSMWCAGCFFSSPAACIDFLVFEARQSEFFLLRHALFVLQWMFL
jgi:hypothetical protein